MQRNVQEEWKASHHGLSKVIEEEGRRGRKMKGSNGCWEAGEVKE